MPLYACNGSAGTQRCRCTSATGPLGRSGVIVRVQRVRWGAAVSLYVYNGFAGTQRCHCTRTTGSLERSDVIVRVQRLSLLNLQLHTVIPFIQIIHLEAQGRELPGSLTAAHAALAIDRDRAGFVELLRGVLGEKAVADIDIHRVADFPGGIFFRCADIDQLDRRVGLQTREESLRRKRNVGIRVRLLGKQAGTKRQ